MAKLPIRDIIIGVNVSEHTRKEEDYKDLDSYNSFYDDDKQEDQEREDLYSTTNRYSSYTETYKGEKSIDIQDYFREQQEKKKKKERREVILFFLKFFLLVCILLWITYSK